MVLFCSFRSVVYRHKNLDWRATVPLIVNQRTSTEILIDVSRYIYLFLLLSDRETFIITYQCPIKNFRYQWKRKLKWLLERIIFRLFTLLYLKILWCIFKILWCIFKILWCIFKILWWIFYNLVMHVQYLVMYIL